MSLDSMCAGICAGKSGAGARFALWLALSAAFTALVVQYSLRYGYLITTPGYDDVVYLIDAMDRLEVFHKGGVAALLKDLFDHPPHSPFSSLLAVASFAIAGVQDWAPYGGNIVIILVLLVFLDHWLGELAWGWKVLTALFALSVPISGYAIYEFRPDIAWGLMTAIGVALLLERPLVSMSIRARRFAGLCFGLALLIKTSTFPVTIVMFGWSLVLAVIGDRWVSDTHEPLTAQLKRCWTCIWPAVVLSLPLYAIDGKNIIGYIYTALVTYQEVNALRGDFWVQVSFYIVGWGGRVMLNKHLYIFAAVLAANAIALTFLRDRQRRVHFVLLGLAVLVAYLIPTTSVVKTQFGGVIFDWMLLFWAVLVLREFLAASAERSGARWVQLGGKTSALLAIAAGLWLWKFPNAYGDHASQTTRLWNEQQSGVLEAIVSRSTGAPRNTFVTFIAHTNPGVLLYRAKKAGHPEFVFSSTAYAKDLDTYLEQLDRADFVLLAEPGMSDLDSRLPSTPLAGPILEAVRARPEFVQIAALPAIGGKQILLFEKQRHTSAPRQRPGP
jgi:hypothetical protein